MARKKPKDASASMLAKKRWKNVSKAERSALMRAAVNKLWDSRRAAKAAKEKELMSTGKS